jgi:hypothetical protein
MNKKKSPVNPSSFSDALTEKFYAQQPKRQKRLERERQKCVEWLRKKFKDNTLAQALADKIEACRRKRRCKSLACPECSDAAQRLFTKATRRYLRGKSGVVCVTIIPATETVNPGSLS